MTSALADPGVVAARPRRGGRLAVIFLAGLALRLALVWLYPPVFGGDTVLRLANPERILLSYQLPLPQLFVYLLHLVLPGPIPVRMVMSLLGALAGVAFYLFATTVATRESALAGTILFLSSPMLLTHSTVPYQEVFLVGGLLWAFYAALENRWYLASLCLAVACCARYEAWLACPGVAWFYLHRRGWSVNNVIQASALFGWAPLLWILYNGGITPPGSFAAETHFTIARLFRWAYTGYITLRNTPVPVILLAGYGAWVVARSGRWRSDPVIMFGGFLVLFLVALLFSAHGTAPNPERYVTTREAHMPIVGMVLLATVGLDSAARYRGPIVALCAIVGLWMSVRFVRGENRDPGLQLAYHAVAFLDSAVAPGQQVVVLTQPLGGLEGYLGKLARRSPDARAAGVRILNTLESTPPEFQRILVHSRLDKKTLHNYSNIVVTSATGPDTVVRRPVPQQLPDWVVDWSDFVPTNEGEADLYAAIQGRSPVWKESAGELSVAVFRIQ